MHLLFTEDSKYHTAIPKFPHKELICASSQTECQNMMGQASNSFPEPVTTSSKYVIKMSMLHVQWTTIYFHFLINLKLSFVFLSTFITKPMIAHAHRKFYFGFLDFKKTTYNQMLLFQNCYPSSYRAQTRSHNLTSPDQLNTTIYIKHLLYMLLLMFLFIIQEDFTQIIYKTTT